MDTTASKIGLANLALYKIGAKRISSFTDGSNEARVINDIYDNCREMVLEEHPWSFAIQTVALQTISITPVDFGDGLSIAYALPEDWLFTYLVNFPFANMRKEEIDGQSVLLCDTAGLIIKYIFNNDDPTKYSAKFYEALACKLAAEACFKLVQAGQKVTAEKVDYGMALLSAMAADSKNSGPDQPSQDEWFQARLAGSNVIPVNPNGNVGFWNF